MLLGVTTVKAAKRAKKQGAGVKFSMNLEQINQQFNNELQQQIDGTLPKGHIYQLGNPSEILQSAGIQDLPMELSAQRLKEKSEQANHIFDIADLKDLPKAINDPIAVFDSRTHKDSKVILTELQYKGNNFVAILRVDKKGELDIDINSINNLYPKDSVIGIYRWLDLGLLQYCDKKKLTDFIAQSTDLIADDNLRKSAAKIVQNFVNPKLPSEKNAFRLSYNPPFYSNGEPMKESVMQGQALFSTKIKDNQGNPLNADGTLIVEKVTSIDELTDKDFTQPYRNVQLPELPKVVDNAIGANNKPIVIKKNIFEKNLQSHKDVSPKDSRNILSSALYNPNLYGQNKKVTRPYNWVLISLKDEKTGDNKLVLLEVNDTKDYVEIVHWHYVRDTALETIKKQAEREGAHILVLPSENSEEAGGLPSRTQGLISNDKVTSNDLDTQEFGQKFSIIGEIGAANLDAAEEVTTRMDNLNIARRMEADTLAIFICAKFAGICSSIYFRRQSYNK